MTDIKLTNEQKLFVETALNGDNILVNACIGSGKTTTIQFLCDVIPTSKRVVYFTYNKLLKLDAQSRIKNKNVYVNNYHGFANLQLRNNGISAGVSDLIQAFLRNEIEIPVYDVMIIDEYQDINLELSQLLEKVKAKNPQMQIIAVGDMEQKIYDFTTLDVSSFIENFLGEHTKLEFTQCFRLNKEYAERLGYIWKKPIIGVNDACTVEKMTEEKVIEFLSNRKPEDLLCLGARTGKMTYILNELEKRFPDKYNKSTVYASISEQDMNVSPKMDSAIFTTYDSSKGLERKICVLFDFTEDYWNLRVNKPQQSYEILRNIFCVAASRGKEHIIFVTDYEPLLSDEELATPVFKEDNRPKNVDISSMFDFKYKESIEECYNLLEIKDISPEDRRVINTKTHDGLIDLSPCIGIYQEASFFKGYDIDINIDFLKRLKTDDIRLEHYDKAMPVERKILFETYIETNQQRYVSQVTVPYLTQYEKERIWARLQEKFSPDEIVQKQCSIDFSKYANYPFKAFGISDVVKDDIVYELKFVAELMHEHFLQCASYMIGLNLEKGILWNVRNNKVFEISITDREKFLKSVANTVLKVKTIPLALPQKDSSSYNSNDANDSEHIGDKTESIDLLKTDDQAHRYFAVIDTETTFGNSVMSIGVVIADTRQFVPVSKYYYVITPEYLLGGMYSGALFHPYANITKECKRTEAINDINQILSKYNITYIFAYNAAFDKSHLSELKSYNWIDILNFVAYKQYNRRIPDTAELYKTGRLKRNYNVEAMYKLLFGSEYKETHNAVLDATDELEIMNSLEISFDTFIGGTIKYRPSERPNNKMKRFEPLKKETISEAKKQEVIQKNDHIIKAESAGTIDNQKTNYNIFIDTEEAARMLGVSKSTVYGLIRFGNIDGRKIKNKYQIRRSSVVEYIEKKEKTNSLLLIIAIIAIIFLIIIIIMFLF